MKPLVLVVEDDEDVLEAVSDVLSRHYEVTTAIQGRAALDVLRSAARLPAVIVLDLMMPVMSGWAFRAAQQQDLRIAHIPVVVMSGSPDIEQSAVALEAAGWIRKPASMATLRAAVSRVVAGGPAEA